MLKVYGSEMCPDCKACKANFEANGIDFEFIDINTSLHNLAAFLKLRDTKPVFEKWKAVGDIGIPGIVGEDGEVFTDWESYLKEKGFPVTYRESGKACSITGKGC
jgi:glutaredoxin-related protein